MQVVSKGDLIKGQRGLMANPQTQLLKDNRHAMPATARGFWLDAGSDASPFS